LGEKNKVGLDFTQITFINWSAGGNNSISGLAKGNFIRNYTRDNMKWNNELIVRYGINKQESQDVRKQMIKLTSTQLLDTEKTPFLIGIMEENLIFNAICERL